MNNYYTQLGVGHEASQAEIQAAFEQQRERYNPDRVATMDDDFRRVAEQRISELERIYHILVDPERRRQYDVSIGLHHRTEPNTTPGQPQRKLTARERWYALGGGGVAIILIALIWMLTGRNEPQPPAMGEMSRPAPSINLPRLGGGQVNLNDYQGQVVLINFWGTWCEPCREEMPALQSAYEQLRDEGFVIIGVNLTGDEIKRGNTEDDVQDFIATYSVTYPIALDMQGNVTNDYRVFPLPTSFFVDAQGQIRFVRVGTVTAEEVTARFMQLKREAAAALSK